MSRPPAKNLGAGDAWGRWVETAISKLSGTTSQVSQQAVNASLSAQATTAAVGRTATDLTSLTTSVGNIQENVGATLDVALTAQEAADLVNSELILLSGKTGRVIYSEVEPTGDDANVNNLWIETTTGKLYSYVNGTWTLVTDERLIAAANTADAATNLANAAQEQADLAKGLAEAAQESADTANTAAGAANTAALSAASDAANAQSTANTANTNALAAQSTADAAEENLLVLAGKTGRTIRQESAPTGADANANNLWIKTSTGQTYSYVGSTWTLITDTRITAAASAATAAQTTATNAATAAATAQTTANNAAAAALAAQNTADTANNKATTADGRYTVAASNPTVSDGSGKPTDAVWEVRSGATMLRRFVWTGTAWTQVKAGQDFIGDKAIGQAQIGDLAVGTAQMADASITNAKIGDLTVASANITDTLTGKTIRGGLLSAGDKSSPQNGYIWVGPLTDDLDNNNMDANGVFLVHSNESGSQVAQGSIIADSEDVYLDLQSSNTDTATQDRLIVTPRDLTFTSLGSERFYADANGNVRIRNTNGGLTLYDGSNNLLAYTGLEIGNPQVGTMKIYAYTDEIASLGLSPTLGGQLALRDSSVNVRTLITEDGIRLYDESGTSIIIKPSSVAMSTGASRTWAQIIQPKPNGIIEATVDQDVPTAVWTTLTMLSPIQDLVGGATQNGSGIRVPCNGFYSITGRTSYKGSTTGSRRGIRVAVNGVADDITSQFFGISGIGSSQAAQTTTVMRLSEGDIVRLEGYHDRGSNLNVSRSRLYVSLIDYI